MKINSIIVVCIGNICRSPVAEKFLSLELGNNFSLSSAGIKAVIGKPMHEISAELLCERGVNDCTHVAKQLDDTHVRNNDLILVMEQSHIDQIVRDFPHARGKTFMLTHWSDGRDIPDPYKKSHEMFEFCVEHIYENSQLWAKKLIG